MGFFKRDHKPDTTPLSHKLSITLRPKWREILTRLAEQSGKSYVKFYKEITENIRLKIKEGEGLWSKSFSFVYFYDAVSGMEQTWSSHEKSFVDDMGVEGHIFAEEYGTGPVYPQKYENNNITNPLIITPSSIGFIEDPMFGVTEE